MVEFVFLLFKAKNEQEDEMKRSVLLMLAALIAGCSVNQEEREVKEFLQAQVAAIEPLEKETNLTYWNAAVTGSAEDYQRFGELNLQLRQIYADSAVFARIDQFRKSGAIKDKKLVRQLDLLYYAFLENQIEAPLLKQIVDRGAQVEQKFSTFRATLDGRTVTSNDILQILKNETNSRIRRDAWLASKQVGGVVAEDIIELVKLRNQAAQSLGFENYHTLALTTTEQNADELDALFAELFALTEEPYTRLKTELDSILADLYGIGVNGLLPWHYHDPFFQETPLVYAIDLDSYYADHDVVELARDFYAGIGLPVDEILTNSDLYEREGKNPHAFCTHIDRQGDVRILCNVKNNESWMETMLHELGHGVYDKHQDFKTPYLLRGPAHMFTTEAIAMFFGRCSRDAAWMQKMLDLDDQQRADIEQVSSKYMQLKQMIFARWAMVMYEFEKQLYADPEQDLNQLWWDLVSKYQQVTPPPNRQEPDWAAKIHFTIAPCYYHNYLLGELLASQLHHTLATDVLKIKDGQDFVLIGETQVGDFLRKKVFEPARQVRWNEMIENATGEPLTPAYFVEQFVR